MKFSKTLENVSAGLTFFAAKCLVGMLASRICCEIFKLILHFDWMKIYCVPNHTTENCRFNISRFFKINFLICLLNLEYIVFCIYKKYLFCIIQNFHQSFSCRIYFTISFPLIAQISWIWGSNRKKEMYSLRMYVYTLPT